MTARRGQQAPGLVKIRVLGRADDVAMVAALLAGHDGRGNEVIMRSAPYANRRGAGQRAYLTVRVTSKDVRDLEAGQ